MKVFDHIRMRREILLNADPEPIEALLSAISLGWAIVLLLPSQIFALTPSYRAMASLSSNETIWGLSILAIGLLSAWAWSSGQRSWRRLAAALQAFLWLFITVMLMRSGVFTTGIPTYGLLTLAAGLVVFRLRGHA